MSENCKWTFLPIMPTDWGSIEAWLNKKAQKGWRFEEEAWMFLANMSYRPSAPKAVYRLKAKNAEPSTIKLRKECGWHTEYTSPGVGCELWWKKTDDPFELCPDAFTYGQEVAKNFRADYLAEIAFAIMLILETPRLSQLPDGFFYTLFNGVFGGGILLTFVLLQWRNLRNSEYIGWPSIILTSVIGPLAIIMTIGSIIADMTLLYH